MYGLAPGLLQLLKDKKREEAVGAPIPMQQEPAEFEDFTEGPHLQFALKKKRRALMMKKMLEDGGYGDLARMINIREG